MLERLKLIEERYNELDRLLGQPEVVSDRQQLQALGKERAGIEDLVAQYREYRSVSHSLEETRAMLDSGLEPEMLTLVKGEIESLKSHQEGLLQQLNLALMPRDANDKKDVIVEIRAGAGGNEAGLFAADLFRMYARYAQGKGGDASKWLEMHGGRSMVVDVPSSHRADHGEVGHATGCRIPEAVPH